MTSWTSGTQANICKGPKHRSFCPQVTVIRGYIGQPLGCLSCEGRLGMQAWDMAGTFGFLPSGPIVTVLATRTTMWFCVTVAVLFWRG